MTDPSRQAAYESAKRWLEPRRGAGSKTAFERERARRSARRYEYTANPS